MDEVELISELIGGIYDAALDRTLGRSVLEGRCAFVNGQTAALMAEWPAQGKGAILFRVGHRTALPESYSRSYGKFHPAEAPAMTYSKVGEINAASDHVPLDELRACRLIKNGSHPRYYRCDVCPIRKIGGQLPALAPSQ